MQSRLYLEPHRRDGDTLEVAACFESGGAPGRVQRLWWRLPAAWGEAVTPWADPFVVAFAFPMMEAGGEAVIDGCVSPSLLANLETFMAIWGAWFPDRYRPVALRAREEIEAPPPAVAGETIVPFSCGVDSCFTALRHQRQLAGRRSRRLGAAVVMNGFDIRFTEPNAAGVYEGVLANARAMLASLSVPCIPMSSNFHELPTTWAHSFGTHLVSGLRLLGAGFDAALIPNSMPYAATMTPWGSNPLSDAHLSSRNFAVVDDGGESTRVDKIALLSTWPEAAQHLRVCFNNPGHHANCGRCEKCIRTLLAFRLAGAAVPAAFAQDVSDRQIRQVRFGRPLVLEFWRELLRDAARRGLGRAPWVRAMRTTERRCLRRWRMQALKRPFIPLRNGLREFFRGSPLSRRQRAAAVHPAASTSPPQPPSKVS